jgi:serine phosphatase RsbU (regulator of sigma subunit)
VQTHLVLRNVREQLAQQLFTIQKELETARQIQLSILPREIPKIAGLDIAARYIPMTSVAGDFYDFIVADEKHVGILIADVSGHGMPAALIASMLKIAFAAQAPNVDDPAAVLHGLNLALCGKFDHHYVTAAYIYFDMEKHSFKYAGAGHPPIITWASGSKAVTDNLENGMFLGKFDFATFTSIERPLSPGDWCLMYTDGIPETANASDEQFGDERFRSFLIEQPWTSADHLSDNLLTEVIRWSARAPGEDFDDDITMVAIRVTE